MRSPKKDYLCNQEEKNDMKIDLTVTDINDLPTVEYIVPQKYPQHSPVGEFKGVILIHRTEDGEFKGVFIRKELT